MAGAQTGCRFVLSASESERDVWSVHLHDCTPRFSFYRLKRGMKRTSEVCAHVMKGSGTWKCLGKTKMSYI